MTSLWHLGTLFRRFLFVFLGGSEALRLFAADRAFPHVISTAIMSHNL
jgi:hypothetical protein